MDITKAVFKRQFAMSMYKNLKLPLGEMTFTKDFVLDKRGDLYPLIEKTENCTESICRNCYLVQGGSVERWIGQFFPYASYEICFHAKEGACGFGFRIKEAKASVVRDGQEVIFRVGQYEERAAIRNADSDTMIVSCRPGAFDMYSQVNGKPELVHTFKTEFFDRSHAQEAFTDGYASVIAEGDVEIEQVSFYIDNGISMADIRPIRCEDGQVMIEQGRVYFTASIRMQAGTFQGVFAWTPGTAKVEFTGALYYDAGDGLWCGDVAASVLYHREKKQWYLWVCSFSHGHMLGHAVFEGEPRFGVNVIDIDVMPKAPEGSAIGTFAGFEGDEDPDFFYDAQRQKWLMAICRLDPASCKYRYVFFESDAPFAGYTCIGVGQPGEETGGSFVRIDGELHFVCGNSFSATSDYRIYRKDGMHNAHFDFPDGGFRGWGTVIPVRQGSRMRYYWLTFDRHNGSDYNWSYGNFYCYEAR